MSSALSETVNYDVAIEGPDDGDPRTAASVNLPLGELANRTLQLRRWLDGVRGAGLPFTADPASNFLNIANNGIATDDPVCVKSTGALPGGLSDLQTYYWNVDDSDHGYLSTTIGGSAVDITTAGTGTHTLYPVGSAHMYLPLGAGESSTYPDAQTLQELLGTIATDIGTLQGHDEAGVYAAVSDADQTLTGAQYQEQVYKVSDPAAARTFSLGTGASGRIISFVLPRTGLTNSVTVKRLGSGNTLLVFGAGCTGGHGRLHHDGSAWHVLSYGGSSVTLGTDY